jgi:hypothetical protein
LGLFFFWRKRNGGGGWSEAPFCNERLGCSSRFAFTLKQNTNKKQNGMCSMSIGSQKV